MMNLHGEEKVDDGAIGMVHAVEDHRRITAIGTWLIEQEG